MKWSPRALRCTAVVISLSAAVPMALSPPALGAARVGSRSGTGPTIELATAQKSITLERYAGYVILDPGIWVASLGSPLELDVGRASYVQPITITQVVHLQGGSTRLRRLPASVLDGFFGLRDFLHMTMTDSADKVVASATLTFCPNSSDPERASADSPAASPYPAMCAAEPSLEADPFQKAMAWGIAKGWAVDPFLSSGLAYQLALGKYQVTASITPAYRHLFGISASDAVAHVEVTVVNAAEGDAQAPARGASAGSTPGTAPSLSGSVASPADPAAALPSAVPSLSQAPEAALPDLVALPSWGITTSHASGQDLLDFGATVWIGGNAPLDVVGFRSNGSPIMTAYQYFWLDGHIIGRAKVGTMGFADYNHWHFEQFATYRLLDSAKSLALRSHKEGFCIAPTDAIDLLLPHAVWQPSSPIGLTGVCGLTTNLSVQEMLPVGWGDTYFQTVPGQSFNITDLPNGTYYIEVIANPLGLLHETTRDNDISLRKVILGGSKGHRTVKVPAWNGIDPET